MSTSFTHHPIFNFRRIIAESSLGGEFLKIMEKFFSYRMAIVQVKPDETNDEAWLRHLGKHPEDTDAKIRVFNRHNERINLGNRQMIKAAKRR
jgi:hypothetical protein